MNRVEAIWDDEGKKHIEEEKVEKVMRNFFEKLFTSEETLEVRAAVMSKILSDSHRQVHQIVSKLSSLSLMSLVPHGGEEAKRKPRRSNEIHNSKPNPSPNSNSLLLAELDLGLMERRSCWIHTEAWSKRGLGMPKLRRGLGLQMVLESRWGVKMGLYWASATPRPHWGVVLRGNFSPSLFQDVFGAQTNCQP
ncbi:hypothetical protein PIB30_030602 [Stylosanthes scabra]|uniref:Uncharacterized protein n=1 Tax=Stylosanthes scabra TaxID=79078 RepID=A0ABU6V9P6_9FABA|nr:hypothetical protein [Stylosanthes scabra]